MCLRIPYTLYSLGLFVQIVFLFSTRNSVYSSSLRTLVVAHHSEDISWLTQVGKEIVEYIYILSSGEEECNVLISSVSVPVTKVENKLESSQPEIVCESIPNHGCEAGAYLNYLFTH